MLFGSRESMSKREYAWILALSMLANDRANNAVIDPEGTDPAWGDITARAGRLKDTSAPSANDAAIAAALFKLLLILFYCGAINRAKIVNRVPIFCKLTGGEISEPIRSIQHSYWAALVLAWLWHQCHSDHLPTKNPANTGV